MAYQDPGYPQQDPNNQEYFESAAQTYRSRVQRMWNDLQDLSAEFTVNVMKDKCDHELKNNYFAQLITLWRELKPHVDLDNKGDNIIDDEDQAEFNSYSRYSVDPLLLNNPDNSDDIQKMQAIMGKILRQLSVTDLKM